MLGWLWPDEAGVVVDEGLEDEGGVPAGEEELEEDEDPWRFGAGLKKHVCSCEAHT
jgi:hypothetical protein